MDPDLQNLVQSGKIASDLAEKISALKPGAFCEHRSWGVGCIQSWDLVEGQIAIDFEDKPGHGMTLEFAANSLKIIPEDHILAQRFGRREELKKLAAADPVQLIRITLESFGGKMHLDALEGVLKGGVVGEGEYKSWWDAAKKKLRQNRAFVVPAKRSQPLEMRADDVSPSKALVSDFVEARDLKVKAKALSSILQHLDVFDSPAIELLPVIDEIDAVGQKALKLHAREVVELVAARDDLQQLVPDLQSRESSLTLAEIARREKPRIGEIIKDVPVTRQRMLLAAFPDAFGGEWPAEALKLVRALGLRGISEIMKLLVQEGQQEKIDAFLKRGLAHRDLNPDALAWICKERAGSAQGVFADVELPSALVNALEKQHLDEESRKASRLHDALVDDRELLGDLVRNLDVDHVRTFARRLISSPVFEELNRRSLLARIIKVHPEVQELVTGGDEPATKIEGLVVSWESLERRKNELEELIKKKIPENSKEIALARSYGDLRENFEYKAAKQMQAVLMRRKNELERDISRARGTDFSEANTSRVAVGNIVTLEDAGGGGEAVTYTVLGAWDSRPEEHVVAYLSDVGKNLTGKTVGDEVELPSAEGSGTGRRWRVKEIRIYVN